MKKSAYILGVALMFLAIDTDAQIHFISIIDSAEQVQLKSKQVLKSNMNVVSSTKREKKYQRGVFPKQLLVPVTDTKKDTSSTNGKRVFMLKEDDE